MCPGKRAKVRRLLMRYVNFCAILVGVTALWLDFERRTVRRSRLLAAYVACINVALLVSLPFAYLVGLQFMNSYANNNLLRCVDAFTLATNFVVIALSIALRRRHQRDLLLASADLFDIDARYGDYQTWDERVERRADWLLYLKFFTFCTQSGVIFYGSLQLTQYLSLSIVLEAFYYGNLQNVLGAIMFYYFYLLWLAYKRLQLLNVRLRHLLQALTQLVADAAGGILRPDSFTLQQLCNLAADDLDAMSRLHVRLTQLVAQLNAAHKWQTTATLLTYLITNISYSYYVAVLTDGSMDIPTDWWFWLGSSFATFVLFLDLSLLYWLADGITGACQRTPQLLRDAQMWTLSNVQLERQLEMFELQLKQRQLHGRIGGMYTLSRQASLSLWAFTLQHTLFLVQTEYESRRRNVSPSLTLDRLNEWLNFRGH